jgi:hypothetical protein
MLTEKQLKFCQLVTSGLDPSAAYVGAGYKSRSSEGARVAASKLLHHHLGVATEVSRLRAVGLRAERKKAEAIEIDQAWLVAEYLEVLALSKSAGSLGISRQCLQDLAKLSGYWSESRSLDINVVQDQRLLELNSSDLLEMLQIARGGASLGRGDASIVLDSPTGGTR